MHFMGKNLYSRRSFFAEAKKIGVNRAIPKSALKKLKWEDKILIGYEHKTEAKADVVGYFVLSGLNMDCSEGTKQKLKDSLDVVESFSGGATNSLPQT